MDTTLFIFSIVIHCKAISFSFLKFALAVLSMPLPLEVAVSFYLIVNSIYYYEASDYLHLWEKG